MVVEILKTLNYPAYFVTVVVIAAVLRSLRACGFSKRVRNCALLGLLGVVVYLHPLPGEPPAPPHRNYLSQQVVLSTTALIPRGQPDHLDEPVSWSPRASSPQPAVRRGARPVHPPGRTRSAERDGGRGDDASLQDQRRGLHAEVRQGKSAAEIVERVALVVGIPVFQGERSRTTRFTLQATHGLLCRRTTGRPPF